MKIVHLEIREIAKKDISLIKLDFRFALNIHH